MLFNISNLKRILLTVVTTVCLLGCASSEYRDQFIRKENILRNKYSQQELFNIVVNYDDITSSLAFYKIMQKDLIEESALKAKNLAIRQQAILDIADLNTLTRLESIAKDENLIKYIVKRRYELENNMVEFTYSILEELKDSNFDIIVNNNTSAPQYIDSYPLRKHKRIMISPGVQNIAVINLTGKLVISELKTDDKDIARVTGQRTYSETTTTWYYPIRTVKDISSIAWVSKPDKYYLLSITIPDRKHIKLDIKEYRKGANSYLHQDKPIKDNGLVIETATYSLAEH